jgi:hypothetical protein
VTYTKDQTQIFLMSEAGAWDATAMASRRGLNFKYEANWKEDGAVCVVRSRYESLAPDCQTEFKNTEGFEGVQYHCKGSPPDLHHGELLTDSKEQQ